MPWVPWSCGQAMPGSAGLQGQVDGGVPRLAKLRANRARIHTIASGHGASSVRVFGSVARGDDGPGSDVDLLVDLDLHTRGLLPLAADGHRVVWAPG